MSFERSSGDDGLRNAERAFNADIYNEPDQVAYFAELDRRGVLNAEKGRAEQERLHAALSERSTPEAATIRMNQILERFKMQGAVVPVETSASAAAAMPTSTQSERRWVSWRRFFREQTEDESKESGNKEKIEVPGRIEKIVRVNLPNAATTELIDEGHYNYVDPRIRPEAMAIEAGKEADTTQRVQEVLIVKFGRIITTDEAKAWVDENDLRASMKQLLAIGSQLPAEQQRVWLATLDEDWLSRGSVPVLSERYGGRRLELDGRDYTWDGVYHFPAARKKN